MVDLGALTRANAARWANAKAVRSGFDPVARRLLMGKARYQAITAMAGVPWFIIAVIHEREASQNWRANIAQGDPWNAKSVHVPRGRGPFARFEDAAVDALVNCSPFAARWKDWSAAGALTLLEQYNGLGYANRGLPSPYIWSGTDQYVKGKYVADGMFDANAVDKQLGCAGLLIAMCKLDSTIRFADEVPAPPDVPSLEPRTPQPAKHATWIAAILAAIYAALQSPKIETALAIVVVGIVAAVLIHRLWPKGK